MTKEFRVPYSSWDAFCFRKDVPEVNPAPLLHGIGTKYSVSLTKPFSAHFKRGAGLAEPLQLPGGRKKVGGELVAP